MFRGSTGCREQFKIALLSSCTAQEEEQTSIVQCSIPDEEAEHYEELLADKEGPHKGKLTAACAHDCVLSLLLPGLKWKKKKFVR